VKNPTESALVRQCVDYLRLRGLVAWRANSGALAVGAGRTRRYVRLAPAGTSDILALLPAHGEYPPGRLCCVEAKKHGARLRPSQVAWLDMMASHGALCLVVRDVRGLELALRVEGVIDG
jgi:hypothetical protein